MRRRRTIGAIGSGALVCGQLAVAAATAPHAGAQDAHAGRAEAEVRAAVEQIFEGMRTADAGRVRAVFARDARFAMIDDSGGTASVAAQSVESWLEAVGTSNRRWDERVYDVEVRVDGAMASVWAPYTFYLDGAVRHCGINSIELLRDASGWKVTQISDTRRTEGCHDPLGAGSLVRQDVSVAPLECHVLALGCTNGELSGPVRRRHGNGRQSGTDTPHCALGG